MLSRKCVWLYLTRMDLLDQEQFFEPNYDESSDNEQQPSGKEPPKKRRRVHKRRCNVCDKQDSSLKRHFITSHVPRVLSSGKSCYNCLDIAVNCLLLLASFFGLCSIDALLWFVIEKQYYPSATQKVVITKTDVQFMDSLSYHLQYFCVDYKVSPPNSPVALCHWRTLSLLLKHCSPEQRKEFYQFQLTNVQPFIIDSHFHLDQALQRSKMCSFSNLMSKTKSGNQVKYAIANYCFHNMPSLQSLSLIHGNDQRLYFAIGVHPRFVDTTFNKFSYVFSKLMSSHLLVGIGEVGLDYSSKCDKETQQRVLQNVAEMTVTVNKTLILHCRDHMNNCYAFYDLIRILKPKVPKFYRIHFHCFCYTFKHVLEWLSVFPNTVFGVTKALLKCSHRDALLYSIDLQQNSF